MDHSVLLLLLFKTRQPVLAHTPAKNCGILLEESFIPTCPCWGQLAHLDYGRQNSHNMPEFSSVVLQLTTNKVAETVQKLHHTWETTAH